MRPFGGALFSFLSVWILPVRALSSRGVPFSERAQQLMSSSRFPSRCESDRALMTLSVAETSCRAQPFFREHETGTEICGNGQTKSTLMFRISRTSEKRLRLNLQTIQNVIRIPCYPCLSTSGVRELTINPFTVSVRVYGIIYAVCGNTVFLWRFSKYFYRVIKNKKVLRPRIRDSGYDFGHWFERCVVRRFTYNGDCKSLIRKLRFRVSSVHLMKFAS